MPNVFDQPGLFFVIATLLPLLSFVVLLLWGAIRWGMRPYAKSNSAVNGIFQAMGGEVPGRGPAFVALAAIALAFVCCLTGFILFHADAEKMHHLEEGLAKAHGGGGAHDDHGEHKDAKKDDHKAEHKDDEGPAKKSKAAGAEAKKKGGKGAAADKKPVDKKAKKEAEAKEKENREELERLEHRWKDQVEWARVSPASVKDGERGTVLMLGYRIDMLSAVMFVMVSFIATLIHLFSIGYMSEELHKTVADHEVHTAHGHYERRGRFGRFFMFLSLFCFSMFNLILTDNLFQIFVSWELVGICSFLLVGFYFERTSASNAANKAFITNRVGDAGFIIGLLIVWTYFGTLNFEEIFTHLRCPPTDAHGPIKIDDRSLAHTIVRGNVGGSISVSPTGDRSRIFEMDRAGDSALIFPRQSGHLHGPTKKQNVFDQPGSRDYSYIPYWMLVVAGLGIFLGCVGKSAQFPLQVWLPDAMEGPTPVSALIHAATMVAAGVYLVGRCYPLFTPEVLLTIAYVGGITLFVAASIAVVMTDIKKVLAYSTVSQLGYMMLGLGIGGWTAGLLHLLTHAFFKALLFLGSGSVIYGCHHQQDMLRMGGLYPKMKITAITMLMGVLAIAGTPLFSGWYSKDEILVGAYGFVMANSQHLLLFLLPLATAGITTFYMFRMWFMTFTGKPRDEHVHEHAHESPWMMTVPLILLAILSICVAWPNPLPGSAHTGGLFEADKSWLGVQLHHHSQPESVAVDFRRAIALGHANHVLVGAMALGVVVLGLLFAFVLYFYGILDPADAKEQFPGVNTFLKSKWYFDELYSAALVRPAVIVAGWCRNFDLKIIDGLLHLVARVSVGASRLSGRTDRNVVDGFVNVLADAFYGVGTWLRNVQTGYLRSYVLFLALAAVAIWVLLYAWATALGG